MTRTAARRARWVAGLVGLQTLAAVFFVADAIGDVASGTHSFLHLALEGAVTAVLVLGMLLNAWQLRELLADARRARATIQAASGAMAELIALRFSEWGLTHAEADVAMLALKGFETEEIAKLRHAALGTVRAQLARIYAKADVKSRAGLAGLFIEDLMAGELRAMEPFAQPALK